MKKDSYYFPHDYHAHSDPKCSALIKNFGIYGYGVYWLIIEVMHEQGGQIEKFPKLIEGLAFQFMTKEEELARVFDALLNDYKLLNQDSTHIWSDRVRSNLKDRQLKYEAKAQAGRIGGLKSAELRSVKHCSSRVEADSTKGKEKKGKEIKEEESADNSFLSDLKNNPAYKGIDLDRELAKMDAWLKVHKDRTKTKAFVIGWLNKIEVPLGAQPERKWL